MRVDLFDFKLPSDRIAQFPANPRDSARLLHVGSELGDHLVRDLPDLLGAEDLLVVNDTRVLPTRFRARRGDATIHVTLHKPEGDTDWWAFARPAKKCRLGDDLILGPGFSGRVMERGERGEIRLGFGLRGEALVAAIKAHGEMPLPPYIKRPEGALEQDALDYQTTFAQVDGSVAAPTAGLHFTKELLDRVTARNIEVVRITLHVGAGTFQPVHAELTEGHVMHCERLAVSEDAARRINAHRQAGGRIVAVGTTSLRTLEAVARDDGTIVSGSHETDLFITPGYQFKTVDRLLTNFHLPRSTLFMLVCAFAGLERMQYAYAHAVAQKYRFFSYGDACLLERGS